MFHFIRWLLGFCILVGIGDAMVRLTLRMGRAAVHAHQHDQLKYSDFTRALLSTKPTDAGHGNRRNKQH